MENKKIKIRIEFCLVGDCDNIEEVTKYLDIHPSKIIKKQDIKAKEFAEDNWIFSLGYKDSVSIYDPFEELVDTITTKKDEINEVKEKLNLSSIILIVVQAFSDYAPEYILTNKCIKFSADTDSEIHFDNYYN